MMWEGKIQQYMFEVNFFDSRGILRMLINFPPFFPEEMHLPTVTFRCHAVRLPDDVRLSGWDPETIS